MTNQSTSLLLTITLVYLLMAACASEKQPAPPAEEAVAAPDEEGFVSVFNGADLTGWTGNTEGYGVENGTLVCLKEGGGNLYVDKEYSDFVLRLEFKLKPGGNNGVGIRAEQGQDAAYYGMEIQILDDSAPEYADLQPWQFHGSVYGVAAAEQGHL